MFKHEHDRLTLGTFQTGQPQVPSTFENTVNALEIQTKGLGRRRGRSNLPNKIWIHETRAFCKCHGQLLFVEMKSCRSLIGGQHMLWYSVESFVLFVCLFVSNSLSYIYHTQNNGKLNLKGDKIKPHHKQRFS